MKRFIFSLSCLLVLLLLPACGEQEKNADFPLLDSFENTRLSDDVQMSIDYSYGSTSENFFLCLKLQNTSDVRYCFENYSYIVEKKQGNAWVVLEEDPNFSVGVDNSQRSLPSIAPGEIIFHQSYLPDRYLLHPLEPGEYRISTRLFDYPSYKAGTPSYILVSATFSYPAQEELPWLDDCFPYAGSYTLMEVRATVMEYNTPLKLVATFPIPLDNEGQYAEILDVRPHIQRQNNHTLEWETAPYFQNVTLGSCSANYFRGSDFQCRFTPSAVYGPFLSSNRYRLILEVDYCYGTYAEDETQVLTTSFCGRFYIPAKNSS